MVEINLPELKQYTQEFFLRRSMSLLARLLIIFSLAIIILGIILFALSKTGSMNIYVINGLFIAEIPYFIASLLVFITLFSICTYLLLKQLVFNKLRILGSNIENVNPHKNPFLSATSTGVYEISDLAGKINNMLAKLYRSTDFLSPNEQLRNQKELTDHIINSTPNSVLVIDRDSKVVLANPAFCSLFMKDVSEIETCSVDQVIRSGELDEAISKTRSLRVANNRIDFNYSIRGSNRVFDTHIINMPNEDILLILNDITQDRERQERLYLSDRLASVGEMSAGIAHELNNPLTGIIGLSLLRLSDNLPSDVKADLRTIYNEAERAATIIKNMLKFARKHTTSRVPVQINSIIENVLILRNYEHKVNNIQVETEFDTRLPEITADKVQLQQVFLNIILNAEQAIAGVQKKGKLTIITERFDGKVRASFIDSGPGISPENMRKIFSPFFTTKEVGEGTGLGLSICYGIIKSHDGQIYVKNELGKGANFIVELPINGSKGNNN